MFKSSDRDIDRNHFLMKPSRVKNMNAAEVQVTAEQIILDGQIHRDKVVIAPVQKVMDEEEMENYKLRKRTDFEQAVKMKRHYLGQWIAYALWEEKIKEIQRARSIFERCLEVDYKHVSTWLKYVDMEMRNKFPNHARNLWERAVNYLPRVDQFWYKYSYMEEILGNYTAARNIFERWMSWKPLERGWLCYLKFEERMGEAQKHRELMYRFLAEFPRQSTYIKVSKYEQKLKNIPLSRQILEKAMDDLGASNLDADYYKEFAKFEVRNKEYQRAREIYKFGLDKLKSPEVLYQSYLNFEKQLGQKEEIDQLIIEKRRKIYQQKLEESPLNYDVWFDLINLELTTKIVLNIRETFEKAVKQVPPVEEKRYWRRYIYLWYNYAIFEELEAQDIQKTQEVLQRALKLVPHKKFSFSKLWIMAGHFQIRQQNLDQARKIFGQAIGQLSNEKVFNAYIELELQLANIDRCRILYEQYVQKLPESPVPWVKYAELEQSLDEVDRARDIYELAISMEGMDMPESLWKSYIDMEIERQEFGRVREIYGRLLEKSKHVKVWISYAQFEAVHGSVELAREVYGKGDRYFKDNGELKEERVMLLENWRETEIKNKDNEHIELVNKKMPKRVKKQRKIKIVEGDQEEDAGYEEYYDYIFPDDQNQMRNLKILQKAYSWKNKEQN